MSIATTTVGPVNASSVTRLPERLPECSRCETVKRQREATVISRDPSTAGRCLPAQLDSHLQQTKSLFIVILKPKDVLSLFSEASLHQQS